MENLYVLKTEQSSDKTRNLDMMDTIEILQAMNESDMEVVAKIGTEISSIAEAVNVVSERLNKGGRLLYVGAGTSGRLGVLDAAECPPTFGVPDYMVQGLIAGGTEALIRSVEGAEDDESQGEEDLRKTGLGPHDVVFAISASGRTPYCIGALKYAKSAGAATISLSCNKNALMSRWAGTAIEIETGPEVLTGSTRLKAGTAEKMVLNMISTASMVKIGKVYQNYMVGMVATNEKLRDRAKRIVMQAAEIPDGKRAEELLERAGGDMKVSIVMALAGVSAHEANRLLSESGGFVRKALTLL